MYIISEDFFFFIFVPQTTHEESSLTHDYLAWETGKIRD